MGDVEEKLKAKVKDRLVKLQTDLKSTTGGMLLRIRKAHEELLNNMAKYPPEISRITTVQAEPLKDIETPNQPNVGVEAGNTTA